MSNDDRFDDVSNEFSPILKEIWELIKSERLDCVVFLRKPGKEDSDELSSAILGHGGTHTMAECMYAIAEKNPYAFYLVAKELVAQGRIEIVEEAEMLERFGVHFSKHGGNA